VVAALFATAARTLREAARLFAVAALTAWRTAAFFAAAFLMARIAIAGLINLIPIAMFFRPFFSFTSSFKYTTA